VSAQPPPPSPPAPAGFPRWPLWLPLAGLAAGLAFGLLTLSIVSAALTAGGVKADGNSPGITAAGTVLVDVSVVVASLLLAGLVARPRPWQLGLRGAPLTFTAQVAGIGALAYILFGFVYQAVVHEKSQQKVVENLGADRNTLLLVVGAVVVIAVAPVCEELFFRGVLFRVLRMRMSFWVAGIVDGIIFGLVHGDLVVAPVLAFLGLVFCYVYERTGTLYATIALHALNNSISYGVVTKNGWAPALTVGALVIGGCIMGILRAPRAVPATAAVPA
jgi:membrane protease YdiL (CAAX protease family)